MKPKENKLLRREDDRAMKPLTPDFDLTLEMKDRIRFLKDQGKSQQEILKTVKNEYSVSAMNMCRISRYCSALDFEQLDIFVDESNEELCHHHAILAQQMLAKVHDSPELVLKFSHNLREWIRLLEQLKRNQIASTTQNNTQINIGMNGETDTFIERREGIKEMLLRIAAKEEDSTT